MSLILGYLLIVWFLLPVIFKLGSVVDQKHWHNGEKVTNKQAWLLIVSVAPYFSFLTIIGYTSKALKIRWFKKLTGWFYWSMFK